MEEPQLVGAAGAPPRAVDQLRLGASKFKGVGDV